MLFKRPLRYEDGDLTLTLPHGWRRQPSGDPTLAQFTNSSGQVLSLSVMGTSHPIKSAAELAQAVADVYQVRLDWERKYLEPDDPLIENGVCEAVGQSLAFYGGFQRSTARLFAAYLYGRDKRIITLYLEGVGQDVNAHMDSLVSIFKRLRVKDAA